MAWRPADAGTTAGLRGHQHGDHSLIRHHYTFYLYAATNVLVSCCPQALDRYVLGSVDIAVVQRDVNCHDNDACRRILYFDRAAQESA